MQNPKEVQTRPIPGYERRYIINTNGEIFSLRRIGAFGPTNPKKLRTWDYLYGGREVKFEVNLCRHSVKRFYVIDLVALAFIGPPPTQLHRACPKNGIWADHYLENIEYQNALERGLSRQEERALQMKQEYDRIQHINQAENVVKMFESTQQEKVNLDAIKKQLYPNTYDKLDAMQIAKALIEFGRRKREAEEAQTKETV